MLHGMISAHSLYGASGFLVGLLVGITGVGGGSLMTPLLILLFGVHPTTAVGTDLLFAASTKATGTLVHGAARTVDWRLVTLLSIGSVPATIVTLILLSRFDLKDAAVQHLITFTLGAVLIVTALFLIAGRTIRERYADRLGQLDRGRAKVLTVALGVVMGVLVTATSVGAGAIGVTILLILYPKMHSGRVVWIGHCPRRAVDSACWRRPLVSGFCRLESGREPFGRIDPWHHLGQLSRNAGSRRCRSGRSCERARDCRSSAAGLSEPQPLRKARIFCRPMRGVAGATAKSRRPGQGSRD